MVASCSIGEAAGLRTHMMVALGAATFAVVAGLVVLAGRGLMERFLPRRRTDDDGSGP